MCRLLEKLVIFCFSIALKCLSADTLNKSFSRPIFASMNVVILVIISAIIVRTRGLLYYKYLPLWGTIIIIIIIMTTNIYEEGDFSREATL